jgi:CheY-like chemotaxis protein
VRPLAAAKHLHLNLALVGGGVQVMGDPGRLQQVAWNLVANAVKFTPEGGHVDVALSLEQEQVRLSVSDSGIGISPDFLPHIFDRFRQAETGASRAHGGLGLGLTIVRHLVEAHGGTVQASSAGLGLGARFVVSLPASRRLLPSKAVGEAAGANAPREAARVLLGLDLLLVDDDPEVCELLGLALRQHGAAVRWASSAAEALARLDATLPDVIVSDIGMPGTDGYALLEQVRRREPERGGSVPAIALTAYASADEVARARAAGFQMHLAKPVDPERVLQAVLAVAPLRH